MRHDIPPYHMPQSTAPRFAMHHVDGPQAQPEFSGTSSPGHSNMFLPSPFRRNNALPTYSTVAHAPMPMHYGDMQHFYHSPAPIVFTDNGRDYYLASPTFTPSSLPNLSSRASEERFVPEDEHIVPNLSTVPEIPLPFSTNSSNAPETSASEAATYSIKPVDHLPTTLSFNSYSQHFTRVS
jgi:hypothetical protein